MFRSAENVDCLSLNDLHIVCAKAIADHQFDDEVLDRTALTKVCKLEYYGEENKWGHNWYVEVTYATHQGRAGYGFNSHTKAIALYQD